MASMVVSAPRPLSRTHSSSAGFFDGSRRFGLLVSVSSGRCGTVRVRFSLSMVILPRLTSSSATDLPSTWPEGRGDVIPPQVVDMRLLLFAGRGPDRRKVLDHLPPLGYAVGTPGRSPCSRRRTMSRSLRLSLPAL